MRVPPSAPRERSAYLSRISRAQTENIARGQDIVNCTRSSAAHTHQQFGDGGELRTRSTTRFQSTAGTVLTLVSKRTPSPAMCRLPIFFSQDGQGTRGS